MPPPDSNVQTHHFPQYDAAESAVDAIVHLAGVALSVPGVAWLIGTAPSDASLWIYGAGLIAMLGASAAYNMTGPGPLKAWFRRIDHAVIYVMIAGTYTPLALLAIGGAQGRLLCVLAWGAALAGTILKLGFPRRLEWLGFALYLAMGWMVVAFIGRVHAALQGASFALLVAGGVIYTLGSAVHLMTKLRFHNAVWHALVLVAAALHFAAIANAFVLPHA